MKKQQKFTRNAGGQTFGHGSTDPKALGPVRGNQNGTERTQINTKPGDANKFDYSQGQPKSEK